MNSVNINNFIIYLQQKFKISNLKIINPPSLGKLNIFLQGKYLEKDVNVFIKYDKKFSGSAMREGQILELKEFKNSPYFPNLVVYENGKFPFVAVEFIDGVMLSKVLYNSKLRNKLLQNDSSKKKVLLQLLDILKILNSQKIVHRDIRPQNIMVTCDKSGNLDRLILIDFSFSIGIDRFPELPFLVKNNRLRNLGTIQYKPKCYKWDDHYSITKIINKIDSNCKNKFPDIWKELNLYKQKLIYTHK